METNEQNIQRTLISRGFGIFESSFSKLKAQLFLFTETWQKRRWSFELWVLKQHSKMSPLGSGMAVYTANPERIFVYHFFVCLFICWNKTRKTILRLLCWEGKAPPGSDHTRAEAQTTCVPKTARKIPFVVKFSKSSFKVQSSKLERLFSTKRGKRHVRALSFEL